MESDSTSEAQADASTAIKDYYLIKYGCFSWIFLHLATNIHYIPIHWRKEYC